MDFRSLDLSESHDLHGTNDIGILGMVNDGNSGDLFQTTYPLSKIDIFIIRAYKIITKESILNSNHIQESLNSSSNGAGDGNDGKGMIVHPQYSNTFNKISKIFNVLLNKGTMGEESSSKKSPIELFHRFQQIIKEIELNFDNCSYSKYFNKINDNLFQIKDSRELRDDPYWKSLSDEVLSVYNPRTGKMINLNRKKNATGGTRVRKNSKLSNNTTKDTTNDIMNLDNTNPNNVDSISNHLSNNSNNAMSTNTNNTLEDDFISMTTDLLNGTDDVSGGPNTIPSNHINDELNNPNDIMLLQKKLTNTLPNNSNSQNMTTATGTAPDSRMINPNGYYTQPTSPSMLNSFPFNMESNSTNGEAGNMIQQPNQILNVNIDSNTIHTSQINSNHRKRRSLGSVNLDALEDTTIDEIMKYTNINKRVKTNDSNKPSKPTLSTLLDNTPNSSISTATTTNASNHSQINNISSTNNTSVADDIMNKFNVTETIPNDRTNTLPQQIPSQMNNQSRKENLSLKYRIANPLQEVRNTYAKVLDEKDKRIQSLENEITLQRQETMWLRKMLIEDMGCVRNLLKEMTNK